MKYNKSYYSLKRENKELKKKIAIHHQAIIKSEGAHVMTGEALRLAGKVMESHNDWWEEKYQEDLKLKERIDKLEKMVWAQTDDNHQDRIRQLEKAVSNLIYNKKVQLDDEGEIIW